MGTGGVTFKLNTGAEIPAIGFGTVANNQEGEEVVKTGVTNALKVGYRHFDTAAQYRTEAAVGEALAAAFQNGLVRREDVFVTTKIFVTDLFPEQVPKSFHKSLSALRLEYVDLYLIHWPIRIKQDADAYKLKEEDFLPLDLAGVWRELEKLQEQGLIKAIGVSNFSVKRLQELLSVAKVPPAVNQVELHPKWQSPKLLKYCNKKGIHVSAYSPLGAPNQGYSDNHITPLLDTPVLHEIGAEHGKTAAQVCLRWVLEQGASVLSKSYNQGRLAQNVDVWDWSLTENDLEKIRAIPQQKMVSPRVFYKGPYKTDEEFWDDDE